MTHDPVCGAKVDETKATATSTYLGKQYAFCGRQCKETFDKNPKHYADTRQSEEAARNA